MTVTLLIRIRPEVMTRNDLMLSSMAVQMEQIVFRAQMNKAMLLLALLIVAQERGARGQ